MIQLIKESNDSDPLPFIRVDFNIILNNQTLLKILINRVRFNMNINYLKCICIMDKKNVENHNRIKGNTRVGLEKSLIRDTRM